MSGINWKETITRPTSPLKVTPLIEELSRHDPPLKKHIYVPKEDKHKIVLAEGEVVKFGEGLVEESTKKGFKDFADSHHEICNKFLEVSEEIREKNLEDLSSQELHDLLVRSQEAVKKIAPSLYGFMLIQGNLKGILKEKLKERNISEKYFDKLARKTKLNENEKEERGLLRIAKKVKEVGFTEEVEKELEKHKEEYGWYPVYDYTLEPWSVDDFKEKVEGVKGTAEKELTEKEDPEEIEKKVEKSLDEVEADQELREWVHLVQKYLFLRAYRTNMVRKFYYNLLPFIEEVGNRLGWDEGLIPYLTYQELKTCLKGGEKPDRDEIESRKEEFLLIKKNDEIEIYTKRWKMMEILRDELHREEIKILDGEGVFEGRVRGTVKMVESAEGKIARGDILVSTMTSPDMTSLIKKASAIVTDEGGMTCHAAVISKEMGVPCVVGTEEATEKLENDDWIEVNANEGKVLKVEQELPEIYNQISIIGGYKRPYFKFDQFASDVEKEMLVVSVGEELPDTTRDTLKEIYERGVEIRMIVTTKTEENLPILEKHNETWTDEIKYNPHLEGYYFGVIDGKKYFQSFRNPRDPEDRIWIFCQNEKVSEALKDYFEEVWEESKKINFEDD